MKRKIIMVVVSLLVFCILLISVNQIRRFKGQVITRYYDLEIETKKVEVLGYLIKDKSAEAIAALDVILDRYKYKEDGVRNRDKKMGVRRSLARIRALKGTVYMQEAQSKMRWLKGFNLPNDDAINSANKAIKEFEVILDKCSDVPSISTAALYQIGYIYYYILDERAEAEKIWRRLINTYPESLFSSMAKFCLGEISTEEFLKISNPLTRKEPFLTFTVVAAKMEKEGDLEKAKEYCRKAMEASRSPEYKVYYVWAARELKRLEEGSK